MSVTIRVKNRDNPYVNLCNSNFACIWSALGFDAEPCGTMDGRRLVAAIKIYIPGLATRETITGRNFISFGLDEDQVRERLKALLQLALIAERLEEPIVWC